MTRGGLASPVGWCQAKALKKDIRKLLGGVEVERFAHRLVDLLFELRRSVRSVPPKVAEEILVEGDPRHFHVGQDGDQRHFDLDEQVP